MLSLCEGSVQRSLDCVPALPSCGSSLRSWWCCWVCICWRYTATSRPLTSLPTVDTNMLGKCLQFYWQSVVIVCNKVGVFLFIKIKVFWIELSVFSSISRMIFTMVCGLLFGSDGYFVGLAWSSCALMFFIVSILSHWNDQLLLSIWIFCPLETCINLLIDVKIEYTFPKMSNICVT